MDQQNQSYVISVPEGEMPIEYHEEPRPTSYTTLETAPQQYSYNDGFQQNAQPTYGMLSSTSSRDTSPANVVGNDLLLNSPYPPSTAARQILYSTHDSYVPPNTSTNSGQILYANNFVGQYVNNGNIGGEVVNYPANSQVYSQGNEMPIGMNQYPSPSSQWNHTDYEGKSIFYVLWECL